MTDKEKNAVLFLQIARDLKVTETTIGIGMVKTLYDLITQQQIEIIMLRKELGIGNIYKDILVRTRTLDDYNKFKNAVKSDAIKDFAERLKERFYSLEYKADTKRTTLPIDFVKDQMEWIFKCVCTETIDNLVKETTERLQNAYDKP